LANNYTRFNFVLQATAEQSRWLVQTHGACKALSSYAITRNAGALAAYDNAILQRAMVILAEASPFVGELGIEVVAEGVIEGVILYAEESGDIEYTTSLLQAFLKEFGIPTIVSFEWAETCSQPRPGQFGGGAVVVSKDAIDSISTGEVRVELEKKHARPSNPLDVDIDELNRSA
jgi:hypothetical protein